MAKEVVKSPELVMLKLNKDSTYNYRERRHDPWDENYELYRDKVKINRLTQRQSVNIPLMKMTVQTLLKDVDDMPVLFFENLDNDKEAEVFKNEYWKWTEDQNNMEIQDIVDKKQVFLYGRSFDQWQIVDGKIKQTVQDPMDIFVSRFTDPTDINSSRVLIHAHIFEPLSNIENNPDYDQEAVKRLKTFYATEQGLIKTSDNKKSLQDKNQKMKDMGVPDVDSPALGETYVEITLHFLYRENEKGKDGEKIPEQLFLYVEADDQEILMKKPLEEVIGVTKDHYFRDHFPYVSWASDVERQDFWSDGVADTVRTPNKVVNSWFSQLVENRTLRNFGMHYYDSTQEGFAPQTFNPVPWGWYGVPGNPNDIVKKVDIPDLSESLDEMQFIIDMLEKATGATSTQQGVKNERQITLGEVELALGEAKERIKGMSKFYTKAWEDRGTLFIKLIEAASDQLDAVTVYKEGRNTNEIYSREIKPGDWMTDAGYRCKVWSQDEKRAVDSDALQKLNAVAINMPDNPKVISIYQRRLLEFAGLSPDDINAIMEYEDQKRQQVVNGITNELGVGGQLQTQGQPQQPQQPQLLTQPSPGGQV